MNPSEVRELWFQALESGEYTQSENALKCESGFCCLGVLADVAMKNNLVEGFEWKKFSDEFDTTYLSYNLNSENWNDECNLHEKILSLVGISRDQEIVIANDNDDKEFTFSQFRDYLNNKFHLPE